MLIGFLWQFSYTQRLLVLFINLSWDLSVVENSNATFGDRAREGLCGIAELAKQNFYWKV